MADTVESADALLEDFGIEGEVEEDEVVGELEVTSFTADFGAEEDLGAFGVGEPGGVTVALEEGEVFVEDGAGVGEVLLEGRFQGEDFFQGRTDEEDFLFLEFLDELEEPGEAGVGVGFGGEGEVGISGIDGELDGELFDVVGGGGGREGGDMGLSLGEALHVGAGIAEDDSARAVEVEKLVDDELAVFSAAGLGGLDEFRQVVGLGGEAFLQGGELFGVGFFGLLEGLDDGGEWAVVGGFVGEVVEVIIAVGVEKAESGEVAFGAELFGGSGEEEEAVGMLGEGIDELVFGAGFLGGPLEVVCFVDDDEVPAGVDG
ncbi:MAG: hypothetical protein RI897_4633, partial [Verrucomicrobiota bacterium]